MSSRSLARTGVLAFLNVAVLAVALVVAITEGSGSSGAESPMAVLVLDGTARIEGPQAAGPVGAGRHDLAAGQTAEILSGDGVLTTGSGSSVELRSGNGMAADSRLRVQDVPTLVAGDALLIAAAGGQSLEAGGARLSLVEGAARISRSTSAVFAVYEGTATLSSGGRSLEGGLPALRQVVVAEAGSLPLSPSPISFGAAPDPWDRRFLGDAIDLGAALDQRATGITTLLRADFVPDIFFYQAVLPGLLHEPAFDQALLDESPRPPGQTLVAAAVVLAGDVGDFESRWYEILRLREAGAGWGVVALELGADRGPILAALDGAVERSPLLFGAPSPQPVFRPAPLPTVRPAPEIPVRPPSSSPSAPSPSPAPQVPVPEPRPPVLLPPQPDEPEGVLDPVVDLLDSVLEGLDDTLGGLL